ncbi:PH (Pleckstrin Homology) domain-containing protein [Albidovulum inexpectatum]|uniref:PH (Pleckstrin Homology) domain-containing protein n=1 Tax=Albidovulum inexpectatum TaxID=196587 RepID=A0A2S5JIK4_9RHOB|nr:PH domain-containing protein [Albidovulum inexpectatum]PPB81272.1 PH (Pleckstrin Homology) domain-containing protein [Albidovulum inexpectatum]
MSFVETFEWRGRARRGRLYLALAVGVLALHFGLTTNVSPIVPALAAIYLLVVLVRLFLFPTRGMRLGRYRLRWSNGFRRYSVPYEDIEQVRVGKMPDGRTACVVRLTDGQSVAMPGIETADPGRLAREFGLRGIPIVQA